MLRGAVIVLLLAGAPAAARAQADLFSPETFHGVADVRLSMADAERAWTDGGQSKIGVKDNLRVDMPRTALVWTPDLGVLIRGHLVLQVQPEAGPAVDVNEAFVELRAPPFEGGQATVKAGMFYPPVSLEHTGTAWTTPDTLSGSVINTWIGEEVLVRGVEVTVRRTFGEHEISASGAAFGWNDTSGTLLSFRGWATHGLMAGAGTSWKLPPLSPFMRTKQAPVTDPVLELDNRAGWYGRLEWRPPAPVVLSAIYYDNAGDRTSVEARQWSWETRFFNAGLQWRPRDDLDVRMQVMRGETLMGFRSGGSLWIDAGYSAAYGLVRKRLGDDALSARLDVFEATDRTQLLRDDNRERGWAATVAWRRKLNPHLDLITEAQHVWSSRNYRRYGGLAPSADETVVQSALRASF